MWAMIQHQISNYNRMPEIFFHKKLPILVNINGTQHSSFGGFECLKTDFIKQIKANKEC